MNSTYPTLILFDLASSTTPLTTDEDHSLYTPIIDVLTSLRMAISPPIISFSLLCTRGSEGLKFSVQMVAS